MNKINVNDTENKNNDTYYFNKIIFGNRKNKKETRDEKKEKIRMRMLTILESIEKNLRKK
jgi:hypothetical protein